MLLKKILTTKNQQLATILGLPSGINLCNLADNIGNSIATELLTIE